MTNEEIQAIFFLECEEALAAAEAGLSACRAGARDLDTINSVFRAIHSIKGGAGAFGFIELQNFTHAFETLLSEVRDGTLQISETLVTLMLHALDLLSDHIAAARGEATLPDDARMIADLASAQRNMPSAASAIPDLEAMSSQTTANVFDFDLDAMMSDLLIPSPEADKDEPWRVCLTPLQGALSNGGEPILLLRELARLGGECVEIDSSGLPEIDDLDPLAAYLSWTFELPGDVEHATIAEIFDFVGTDCLLTIERETVNAATRFGPGKTPNPSHEVTPILPFATPKAGVGTPIAHCVPLGDGSEIASVSPANGASVEAAAVAPSSPSIRIDLPKLDRLIDNVGELVIAQAMLAQRLSQYDLVGVEEISIIDTLTREIQESAMAIRAIPIRSVFSRVPRMLRDLEAGTGKRVRLEVTGEATELDKTVLERLGDPLTHLIRNAVDHGLEDPEARIASGKPAEGRIQLSAEQRGGRILVSVSDDGRGIDRTRVLAKAIERKLVVPDAVLSDEEIDNLIFAPGFSTANTVSNISGRGVGMDVVRQNVKDLGGRISIESHPGQGSTFTLALPLTLAISDGMIVKIGDQTLVVPLVYVVESLRPEPHEINGLGAVRRMLNVRGNLIPVVSLEHLSGLSRTLPKANESVLIIVDTERAGRAALQVDEICDQRQFVIKSLDAHYRPVAGVAGATILGDGRVALIADVDSLVSSAVAPNTVFQAAA